MAKDFRSKQIRTSKLIGSGGISAGTPYLGLAVYDHRHAVNNAGTQKYDGTLEPSMLNNVGRDVWMFVSGARSHPQWDYYSNIGSAAGTWHRMLTGSDPGRYDRALEDDYHGGKVVLFGGDVVISGTLYADRQVMTVDETVRGDLLVPHTAHVSESLHVKQGAVFNIESGSVAYGTIGGVPDPGNDFVIHGSSVANLFFVDSSTDRIGIGDSTPDSKFEISATGINALSDTSDPTGYHLRLNGSTSTGAGTGFAFGSEDNVGAALIWKDTGANAQGELQFYTKDSTTNAADPEQRVVITNDGKVGIGENGQSYDFAPDTLLEVYGTTTQLKLSNNADDYATLAVGTHGDLTVTTLDDAATAAHFKVYADGSVVLDAALDVDIDADGGKLTLDGSGGIDIGVETDVAIDMNATTLDIDASSTVNIASSRNGASSVTVTASAGGVDITATGAGAGEDINITATGSSVNVSSTEDIADAIVINATTGGIDITADGAAAKDLDLTCTNGSVNITSGEVITDSMVLSSAGGIDITAASGVGNINITATEASDFTVITSQDAEDLTLEVRGATNSSLLLLSAGTGADAIAITTSAGGMDLTVAGAAADEDLDLLANSSINLTSTENAANSIHLHENASGGAGTIKIHADQGTAVSDTAASVQVTSDVGAVTLNAGVANAAAVRIVASNAAGGIDVDAGTGGIAIDTTGGFSIDSDGAASNITLTADAAGEDLTIAQDGGVNASVHIRSAGTAADALTISTSAGGMDLTVAGAAAGENLDLVSNTAINLLSTENEPDAITINAAAGGIDVTAAGAAGEDIDLTCTAGSINITGGEADADAIIIRASNAAGGINIDAGTTGILVDTTGPLSLDSTYNNASAINITTNAGTSEKILVKNTQGNTEAAAADAAIKVESGAGGITLDAALDIHLSADGGNIVMDDGSVDIFDFNVDDVRFTIYDDADTDGNRDYFRIAVGAAGATSISTNDDGGSGANLTVTTDGNLEIDSTGTTKIDSTSTISIGTENAGVAVFIGHTNTSLVTINDNLAVTGDLTVNGTTTTVNSTVMTVDDPVLTLGGDTAPGSDDNKDRGVEFRHYEGSAKIGFIGYDNSASVFTLIPDATVSSETYSGNPGTLRVRQVDLYDDGAENIAGDGTDITFTVGSGGDINIPSGIGLVFDGNGGTHKIESDGTDLLIENQDANGDITIDANDSIYLNANDAGKVVFKDDDSSYLYVINDSAGPKLYNYVNDEDLLLAGRSSNTVTEVCRIDSTASSLLMASTNKIEFTNANCFIHHDGTDLVIQDDADIKLNSGAHLRLDAGGGVIIDSADGDITFRDSGVNQLGIDLDGTSGQISILIKTDSDDLVFKQFDGNEVIRVGDDRKLYFFDQGGEHISSDGTNLTLAAGVDIKLTAGGFVEVPANVQLTFDGTAHDDKISSNGTDMTISAAGGDIILDAGDDIILDAAGNDIEFKAAGTSLLKITNSSSDVVLQPQVSNKDIIFKEDGGTEIARLDSDAVSLLMAGTNKIEFTDGNSYIHQNSSGGGTLHLVDDNDIWLDAAGDIFLDGGGGNVYIKDDGVNQLRIAAAYAGGSVSINPSVSGDDLVIRNAAMEEVARFTNERKLHFFDSGGEHISSDGTDLSIASGGDIKLTATTNVEIPATKPLNFDGTTGTSKITFDNTDMVVNSVGDINLTPAANKDVNIPANIGITFGNDGEKIEGSGTGLTVAGGTITLDSEASILLDAGDGAFTCYHAGSSFMKLSNESAGPTFMPQQNDEDIVFKGYTGSSFAEAFRLDSSESSLLIAAGKKIHVGGTSVSLNNGTDSWQANELIISSSLMGVDTEEAYFSGDVFVSGTLTPALLSLTNLDLAANGYIRWGDANNYIQRVSNDLTFRDGVVGAVKTLADLASIGAIGNAFEMLSTQSPNTLKIRTTGSFGLGAGNKYAEQIGTDLYFYVSGSVDRGASEDIKAAAFGGDLIASGCFRAGAIFDSWSAVPGTVQYALSASMEEVGFQAPLVGKNTAGLDMFSILPGYDLNRGVNTAITTLLVEKEDGNAIVAVNDGGTPTEVFRLQGNNASMRMAASKNLEFGGTSRYINSANTTAINYVNSNTGGAHNFTGHLIPNANNTYDMGSETSRWRNIYTGDLNLKNDRGDWTIIEESDYLCVINNATGKKFKMVLEPIEENE